MAYHDETGEFIGFRPDIDEDDRDKLNEAASIKQAIQHLDNQEFAQQVQQRDAQRHLAALEAAGMSPQEYQMHLANNPAAFQQIKEEAIYGATRELAQRFKNQQGQRPRDSQGRFASAPRGKKPRKSADQFRAQVAEHGKISGDSDEATAVLEALLSQ
ncbi:MAG: hypothetical protein HN416_16240 [Nitrospina sp.]|jgi:hypothetical protein|nr:hypothetical protein [Nitrospina sp.]